MPYFRHTRCTSQKHIFLYKVVEALVHAIDPEDYLKETRSKANPKKFENYQSTKIAEKFARNNSKCFDIPPRKTQQYSKSFLFVKTPIDSQNHISGSNKRREFQICSNTVSISLIHTTQQCSNSRFCRKNTDRFPKSSN